MLNRFLSPASVWQKLFLSIPVLVLLAASVSPGQAVGLRSAPVPRNIRFETVVGGLDNPLFATHAGDGSNRLFIVQRVGQILIYKNGSLNAAPFLDISGLISLDGGEQGLLGLAFAPDYETSGRFYVSYTDSSWAVTLARYTVSANPDVANPSGSVLLTIPKTSPYTNHNGGMLAFGPDGYLYMSVGDGGGPRDPDNNGQNLSVLLGKILRLDVSGATYAIPPTNPFYNHPNPAVREEIWSYGLRNPWRFSFDSVTGDLYIGDVGAATQEEVDFQPAGASGGRNYGWDVMEGNLCHNATTCTPPPAYVPPVMVYDHGANDENGCSITGGYVYRGSSFANLQGVYLYADFCLGKVWGLKRDASNQWVSTLAADTDFLITSFGEDEQGELYLFDYGGTLYHIAEAPVLSATIPAVAAEDGYVLETGENSGKGGVTNASLPVLVVGDDAYDRQFRSILSFDTGSLPDNAVILSATLKVRRNRLLGEDPFLTHGKLWVEVGSPFFGLGYPLEPADFQAASGGIAALLGGTPVNSWHTARFNLASLPKLNRVGNTQLRLRFNLDDNDDLGRDTIQFFSANSLNLATHPLLLVTYFLP